MVPQGESQAAWAQRALQASAVQAESAVLRALRVQAARLARSVLAARLARPD